MSADPATELGRFQSLVLQDEVLFERLHATADLDAFISLAVRIGGELGCQFSEEDVRQALQQARRDWLMRWI